MRMRMRMKISSIDIEVIGTVFIFIFFYGRYFKHLKHKQKHLSNIQLDICKSKKSQTKASK